MAYPVKKRKNLTPQQQNCADALLRSLTYKQQKALDFRLNPDNDDMPDSWCIEQAGYSKNTSSSAVFGSPTVVKYLELVAEHAVKQAELHIKRHKLDAAREMTRLLKNEDPNIRIRASSDIQNRYEEEQAKEVNINVKHEIEATEQELARILGRVSPEDLPKHTIDVDEADYDVHRDVAWRNSKEDGCEG